MQKCFLELAGFNLKIVIVLSISLFPSTAPFPCLLPATCHSPPLKKKKKGNFPNAYLKNTETPVWVETP